MSKNGDGGKELLGEVKGGVKLGGPQERFSWTLKGVGERSKDLGGVSGKSPKELERWCPRNSVSDTANSHLPRPIVRP